MGYFITLYSMPNLVKESKKYGTYTNNIMFKDYPRVQVISVEDILNGKTFDLPISVDVVKSAERKRAAENQPTIFDQNPS